MKVSIQATDCDRNVLLQLLAPWIVSLASPAEADVAINYRHAGVESRRNILIPSQTSPFMKKVEKLGAKARTKTGGLVHVTIDQETFLTVNPQTTYFLEGSVERSRANELSMEVNSGGSTVVLTLDIVNEYKRIVDNALNAKSSVLHDFFTNLPISYHLAPEKLRNLYMKGNMKTCDLSLHSKLPLDALRFILALELERVTGQSLQRRFWSKRDCTLLLTHDVETRSGLAKAKELLRIEQKYDLPAAWYIPSRLCEDNMEAVRELANNGEVGAHDTKHDGKLEHISNSQLVRRVLEAKRILESRTKVLVAGFRAPLLQHNTRMLRALKETGYAYDTSIPTWEPLHPRTRKSHGIGSIYPLTLEGITEIPVTIPQDHQLLRVMNMAPKQVVSKWMEMIGTIKKLGGLCTVLVHPDYEFTYQKNLAVYEEWLAMLASDNAIFAGLPKSVLDSAELPLA